MQILCQQKSRVFHLKMYNKYTPVVHIQLPHLARAKVYTFFTCKLIITLVV